MLFCSRKARIGVAIVTQSALTIMLNALNRYLRPTSVKTLKTSTHVPNSDIKAIDNSQGAARTTAELSGVLDESLKEFDFRGKPTYVGAGQRGD